MVDDHNFEWLNEFTWSLLENKKAGKRYAVHRKHRPRVEGDCFRRRISSDCFYMHRLIMRAPKHLDVDHIDGNGLNNLEANLRLATRGQNRANSKGDFNSVTGFKGVTFFKRTGTLACKLFTKGKRFYSARITKPLGTRFWYTTAK